MSNTNENVLTGRVGAPVRILLESVPGTGAIWCAADPEPSGALESRDSIPVGEGVGGAAVQVFEFLASAPGTYTVHFQLKRIWEQAVRKQRHVIIEIEAEA